VAAHREAVEAERRAWEAANSERVEELRRTRQRDLIRQWALEHPEKTMEYVAKRKRYLADHPELRAELRRRQKQRLKEQRPETYRARRREYKALLRVRQKAAKDFLQSLGVEVRNGAFALAYLREAGFLAGEAGGNG